MESDMETAAPRQELMPAILKATIKGKKKMPEDTITLPDISPHMTRIGNAGNVPTPAYRGH